MNYLLKNIPLSLILALTIGCTKSESPVKNDNSSPQEEVYNLDSQGIGFFNGEVEYEAEIDLGSISSGKKTQLITIKNMGTAKTGTLTAVSDSADIFITSSSCASKKLSVGGSCSLTLNFNSTGKAPQEYTANLNFGASTIPVKIEISSPEPVVATGLKFYDGTTVLSSLDLGSIAIGDKITKTITIKNEGTAKTAVSTATLSTTDYYLTSSSCASKALAAGASCSAVLNFSASGKVAGSYPVSLSFAGQSLNISSVIAAPPAPAPAVISFLDGSTVLSTDLNLGSYSANATLAKTITVRNDGAVSSKALSVELDSNNSGYYLLSNSCVNKILSAGATCSFSVRVSTAGKAPGVHSVNLKMDQSIQVVSFIKTCPEGTTENSGVCISNNVSFTVSNISLSSDGKQLIVTGSGLTGVTVAKLLNSNQSEIDSMIIFSQSATQLILKPSKDLVLSAGEIILRIL